MLYDKRWDAKVETKVDPFKLETLIAWLEKQDPKRRYDYCNPFGCLMGVYLKEMGVAEFYLDHFELRAKNKHFNSIAQHEGAPLGGQDWTYGAALKRARAALNGK